IGWLDCMDTGLRGQFAQLIKNFHLHISHEDSMHSSACITINGAQSNRFYFLDQLDKLSKLSVYAPRFYISFCTREKKNNEKEKKSTQHTSNSKCFSVGEKGSSALNNNSANDLFFFGSILLFYLSFWLLLEHLSQLKKEDSRINLTQRVLGEVGRGSLSFSLLENIRHHSIFLSINKCRDQRGKGITSVKLQSMKMPIFSL
ncbi:hypothetical protein KI387_033496, partial [Taxus chinensis]